MDKDDRLSAGWTMEQYEHQYRQAFAEAAKAADPTWKAAQSRISSKSLTSDNIRYVCLLYTSRCV